MSITLKEVMGRPVKVSDEHQANIDELLIRINKLRDAYGKPLQVTSGYRTLANHLAIYSAKGITDKKKIPMKSRHLSGQAVDIVPIEDDISHLQDWIKDNLKLMEEIGLWFEDFSITTTWVHAQIIPPGSGKRFFLP